MLCAPRGLGPPPRPPRGPLSRSTPSTTAFTSPLTASIRSRCASSTCRRLTSRARTRRTSSSAPSSYSSGISVHPRTRRRRPASRDALSRSLERASVGGPVTTTDSTRQATWSQSLERGLAILSAFGSDKSTIGVSELSRELELEPQHHPSLHRDADLARVPAAGCGDEALPARTARPRPGLCGDQLDGHPRDLGPAPAGSERRDRVHRQHGDSRRARRGLHRALPDVPRRGSARST